MQAKTFFVRTPLSHDSSFLRLWTFLSKGTLVRRRTMWNWGHSAIDWHVVLSSWSFWNKGWLYCTVHMLSLSHDPAPLLMCFTLDFFGNPSVLWFPVFMFQDDFWRFAKFWPFLAHIFCNVVCVWGFYFRFRATNRLLNSSILSVNHVAFLCLSPFSSLCWFPLAEQQSVEFEKLQISCSQSLFLIVDFFLCVARLPRDFLRCE